MTAANTVEAIAMTAPMDHHRVGSAGHLLLHFGRKLLARILPQRAQSKSAIAELKIQASRPPYPQPLSLGASSDRLVAMGAGIGHGSVLAEGMGRKQIVCTQA